MCTTLFYLLGGRKKESEYIFSLVKAAATKVIDKKKLQFAYKIGNVAVCRVAFCLALGLGPNNGRFRKYEAQINAARHRLVWNYETVGYKGTGKMDACEAFLRAFVVAQSEKSPSSLTLYVPSQKIGDLYTLYSHRYPENRVTEKTLKILWYRVLRNPIVDPVTSVSYDVKIKKIYAPGFAICNLCVSLKLAVALAKTKPARNAAIADQNKHKQGTRADRTRLQDYKHECKLSQQHVGFSIDAADVGKFVCPTHKSKASCLSEIHRIKVTSSHKP